MLYQSTKFATPLSHLFRQTARTKPTAFSFPRRQLCNTPTATFNSRSTSFLNSYRFAIGCSLPLAAFTLSNISTRDNALQCASDRSYASPNSSPIGNAAGAGSDGLKEAESMLNLRDLGFGTVSGICVGVFVKKGLRAAAFLLGGVFVFMQYMSSRSLLDINWSGLTSSYDKFITSRAGPPASLGGNRLKGIWSWFIDFVGADVQSRATFVAGVLLGMRIG